MGFWAWGKLMPNATIAVAIEGVAIQATPPTSHVMFPEALPDHGADRRNGFTVLELVDSGRRETHATSVSWSGPEKKSM